MRPTREERAAEHRQRIAEIVVDLIAQGGLDSVTVRAVAERAGYSTTVVTHYFENKKALLLFAYLRLSEQSYARVHAALAHDETDLLGLVNALAYTDHPEYWRVYFAFWQIALVDPGFLQEQEKRTRDVQEMIVALLQRRVAGALSDRAVLVEAASEIIASVQGLGLQAILHPGEWSADRKTAFLARLVDRTYRLLDG